MKEVRRSEQDFENCNLTLVERFEEQNEEKNEKESHK
jgi:hypothetical protein